MRRSFHVLIRVDGELGVRVNWVLTLIFKLPTPYFEHEKNTYEKLVSL